MKHLFSILLAVCALTATAQLPSYLPTEGLVGWWPFNGNANDESGNGNHGVVNGATLVEDRFSLSDAAFSFSSDIQNINCGNSPSLGLTENTILTINYWTSSANNRWPFINKYQNSNASNSNYAIGNGGSTLIVTGDGSNSAQISLLPPTGWNNLCIIFNSPADSVTIYINGAYIQKKYIVFSSLVSTSSLIFGPRFNATTGFYQTPEGRLDDIAIYNRALTPEEITALYTGVPTNNNGGSSAANTSVPSGISYQAVARNAQGQPLSDAAVQVKFTLLTDSLTGAAEYSESHSLTTNSFGLFTTVFGAGTPLSGTFAAINWAAGSKYLNVELDAGNGFVDMGTQQLLSVPYAMRSNTSVKASTIENGGLPIYVNNATALEAGLQIGQMYRTPGGVLMIVY